MRRRLAMVVVSLAVLATSTLPPDPLGAQARPLPPNRNPRPAAFTFSGGIAGSSGELGSQVVHTSRGPLVGGSDAGPHVALGAAFPWTGTALEVRVEAFFNQLRGPRNTVLGTEYGSTARMATRDRTFGVGPVLLWRARPGKGFGPYLMTGAGFYHTRLTSAPMYDDPDPLHVSGTSLGLSVGAGVEAPIMGRTYFFEIRRHAMYPEGIRGASFVPMTFGTRF